MLMRTKQTLGGVILGKIYQANENHQSLVPCARITTLAQASSRIKTIKIIRGGGKKV